MAARFQILYVCVANVCRSVMAERLTRAALPAAEFDVSSAGTQARPGRGMHPLVREVLAVRGADVDGFASRRLVPELVRGADLVLTATAVERDAAIAMVPDSLPRTFTIREFAWLSCHVEPATDPAHAVAVAHRRRGRVPYVEPEWHDIPDPPAHRAAFDQCAAVVSAALKPGLAALSSPFAVSRGVG